MVARSAALRRLADELASGADHPAAPGTRDPPRGNVAIVTDTAPEAEPRILARAAGGLGRLTLNRPRAINALDLGMVQGIAEVLDAWDDDTDVDVVLLDGAGDRGFCAGGDVRDLYDQIGSGDPEGAAQFFRAEYAVNARIAEYRKPIVALADGITMGGGIGLAGHASLRVVTERSKLAMPETRIGFCPDVGGTWLLGRAPGRLGEYLGLTGGTMDAADAIYAGFADTLVPSENLEGLRDALETRADPTGPGELVLLFDETPGPSALEAARPWIDDAFAAPTVAEIVERLRARPEAEASATADLLDDALAHGPGRDARGGAARPRAPRSAGRARAGVRPRDVVRHEPPRPRRGDPRPARRQGPVAALAAGDHRRAVTGYRGIRLRVRPRDPAVGVTQPPPAASGAEEAAS